MDGQDRKSVSARFAVGLDWWDRVHSIAGQIGVRSLIATALSSAGLAAFAWFRDNVPWYLAVLLFLIATAATLTVIHRVQLIRTTARYNPRDYKILGQEMVELSREIFRFHVDRQRDQAELHRLKPRGPDTPPMAAWEADRDFDYLTGRLFFEKFGSRALGLVAVLQGIGITMPPHMIRATQSSHSVLPQFLALMGDLLSQGRIADAVAVSNDRDFMWQLQM